MEGGRQGVVAQLEEDQPPKLDWHSLSYFL